MFVSMIIMYQVVFIRFVMKQWTKTRGVADLTYLFGFSSVRRFWYCYYFYRYSFIITCNISQQSLNVTNVSHSKLFMYQSGMGTRHFHRQKQISIIDVSHSVCMFVHSATFQFHFQLNRKIESQSKE